MDGALAGIERPRERALEAGLTTIRSEVDDDLADPGPMRLLLDDLAGVP